MKEITETLRKKLKVRNRQVTRLRERLNKLKTPWVETPKKQTETEIKSLNLTPKRRMAIRRKLMLGNAVISEIKEARKSTSAKKR